MTDKFTIGEIAELLDIEKSTLRYWDSKGLIPLERNKENNYREYTMKTVIDISDIAFYRSLNMPIKNVAKLNDMKITDLEQVLCSTNTDIENQIKNLEVIKKNIIKKQYHIEEYKKIMNHPFTNEKPDLTGILPCDLTDKGYWKRCLYDPYQFVIVIDCTNCTFIQGIPYSEENHEKHGELIWEDRYLDKEYVTAIIEISCESLKENNIKKIINRLIETGKTPKQMIGRYLFTATNIKRNDYYKVWIEV